MKPDDFRELLERVPPTRALGGVAPNGYEWAVHYGATDDSGNRHWLVLVENGGVVQGGAGMEIPDRTEIGFASGLKPDEGNYYLYGLVTSRIARIRVEGREGAPHSEVLTVPVPGAVTDDGEPLRGFGLVRPPIDDVAAIVGTDREGAVVQRISLDF